MKITVEPCYHGNNKYSLLLSHPKIGKVHVYTSEIYWDRQMATECLDYLEIHYGLNRKNVRFEH